MSIATALLILLSTLSAHAAEHPIMVGSISQKEWKIDCGCRLIDRAAPARTVLYGDLGSSALVKVDGKLVWARLVASDLMQATKSGDSFSLRYRAKNLKISYNAQRLNECPKSRPNCGQLRSKGQVLFQRGRRVETKEVDGRCDPC